MSFSGNCSVKCILPDGVQEVTSVFPARWTVDQVKKEIFNETPRLYALSRDQFVLGLNQEEVFLNENKTFVSCAPAITTAFHAGKTITIWLYSIQHLQNQRLSTQRAEETLAASVSPITSRHSVQDNGRQSIRKFKFLPEALASFDNPEKEGFLKIQGKKSFQSWRRRWCLLKDNFISCFKEKQDTKPAEVIPLQDAFACVKGEKRNTFTILSRTRTWVLGADKQDIATEWMDAIRKCLEAMGKTDTATNPTDSPSSKSDALPLYSFANAAKTGWLIKSGGNRKNWKKRWCILKDLFIYYFPNPQAIQPAGAIPLQDCYVEPVDERIVTASRKNGFSIITRHRTYDLFTESSAELREWMDIISSVVTSRSRIAEIKEIEESKAIWKKNVSGENSMGWETKRKATRLISCLYQQHHVNRAPLPSQEFPEDLKEKFGLNIPIERSLETLLFQYAAEKTYERYKGMELIIAETTNAPVPEGFPSEFAVHFHFMNRGFVKAVKTSGHTTIRDAIISLKQRMFKTQSFYGDNVLAIEEGDVIVDDDPEEEPYVVKIKGKAEYVLDTGRPLSRLAYVRHALSRRAKIEFCLINRADMKKELEEHKLALESRVSNYSFVLQTALESLQEDPDAISQDCYSISDVSLPFEIRAICVEGGELAETNDKGEKITYSLDGVLYWGRKLLGAVMSTGKQSNPLWGERVVNKIRVQNLPLETRICFSFNMHQNNTDTPLAWVNMYLFDEMGTLKSGLQKLRMWVSSKSDPLGTCEPCLTPDAPILNIELLKSPLPIAHLHSNQCTFHEISKIPDAEQVEEIDRIIKTDPLYWLSEEEKTLIWNFRYFLIYERSTCSLAKLLLSVEWTDPLQVQEIHALICCWTNISPIAALELLDRDYPDTTVREYAVRCLEVLSDYELLNYLLQLVQVLKWETRHESALSRFLLRRALQNKRLIGHALFWHLTAELHTNEARYQLLLEAYLRGCGQQIDDLARQVELVQKLRAIAIIIKKIPKEARKKRIQTLRAELEQLKFERMALPLNPRWEVNGIVVAKCKSMESFTAPLWLVFQNVDTAGDPVLVIYKVGDDVRQDVLTLQMLREMDTLWKNEGLDLQLTPYGCMSTGQNEGMIEVVLNSATAADIQKMAGGATAAFKQTPLYNWLQENNQNDELMKSAVDNFTVSLAGYSVAKYVIGIGDRHNDNIMVCTTGHLFHIDFAHFLGNVMKFAGISRERTPIVLTKEFAYVMGGEKSATFARFVSLCIDGYRIARKYSNTFMILFSLMLSSGLPQLNRPEDLEYLHESFAQEKSEEEAVKMFYKLIFESLNSSASTSFLFAVHILANPGT